MDGLSSGPESKRTKVPALKIQIFQREVITIIKLTQTSKTRIRQIDQST